MLDSELKFYFKTNLSKPSIDFKWSNEDNSKLFAYLNDNFEKEWLQDTQNQLKIKQAFKEYFEPVGYILFKLKDNNIHVKVFPYKIEPKDSVNLSSVLEILQNNENLIEYDYKGNENQISIPLELKTKVYDFVNSIDNEEVNKKELVRFVINQFFKLRQYDIVIIKEDQIFIKILDEKYKRTVPENEKNTVANRYNGINEEELKSLYDEFFSKLENKNFFFNVAKIVVQKYLLDEKIDHNTYEKNIFSYIQYIISEQINNEYCYENDFCKGFSGYVFRLHFKEVFAHIATLLLAEIAAANEHIIDFLRYYSAGIVVVEGKKYKVPEFESENGLRWNVISMLSIAKIYIRTKTSIDKAKEELEELNKKIKTLYINNHSPLEYQNSLIKEQEKIEVQMSRSQKKLDRLIDSFNLAKDENKKTYLKEEIQEIKEELQKLGDEKSTLKSKTVEKSVILQYSKLRIEIDTLVRQIQREENVLAQNEVAYISIKYALIKALTSKKTLLE